MKVKLIASTAPFLALGAALASFLPSYAVAVPLLGDNFSGTSLDGSQWTITDGSRGVSVSGGNLVLSGSPEHKRVNSIASFSPGAGLIEAKARIAIGGDYQKFGFGVNS